MSRLSALEPLLGQWFGDKTAKGQKKAALYGALVSLAVAVYYVGYSYFSYYFPEPMPPYYSVAFSEVTFHKINALTGVVCVLAALYSAWAIYFRKNFLEIFGMYVWVVFEVVGCVLGGFWKSLPVFLLLTPVIYNCYRVFLPRPVDSFKDLILCLAESSKSNKEF